VIGLAERRQQLPRGSGLPNFEGITMATQTLHSASPPPDLSLPVGGQLAGAGRSIQSLRVLVVDDNIDAAEVTGELLRTFGHEVEVAHDGPAALLAIERFQPAVAILDLGLPLMDGYELAERILARWKTSAPRLIALSGYGQKEDRRRSLATGFAVHLLKPVDVDELERQVSAR
jgi:CheY-like chemotaxis protein